jgi:hypothetical protein
MRTSPKPPPDSQALASPATAGITPLTASERAELAALEEVIEAGQQSFVQVGLALASIRDGKLYRETHSTFEEYVKERFHVQRRRAYQLMDAAVVAGNVYHGTQDAPLNERQARALGKVKPDQQAAVLDKAKSSAKAEGKPLTAKHIESAANGSKTPFKYEDLRELVAVAIPEESKVVLAYVTGEIAPDRDAILCAACTFESAARHLRHWAADETHFPPAGG